MPEAMIDSRAVSSLPGKIFLFGVNSIVGWSIARLLSGPWGDGDGDVELFCNRHTRIPRGARWRRLNLQDESTAKEILAGEQPDVIIHCAGVCDVEKCETSPQFAHEVNVGGMETLLARAPAAARIVYLSSDHVFGGDTGPYTESSPTGPISVYGRTRVIAEQMLLAHRPSALVVRGGLWIGPSYNGRIGHMDWLRYRHSRGLPMTVVADEHRSAVWAEEAARRVLDLTASPITGVRHVVATRTTARPALAHYLNERFAIGATFSVHSRADRTTPHLGRVELRTEFADALATPLTPVVP
jgi:dTDP-4-dehydrorhamnose reductase